MVTIGNLSKGILVVALSLFIPDLDAADTNTVPTLKPALLARRVSTPNTPVKSTRNEGFDRYTSIFAGPPGPTMPLGATINPSASTAGLQPAVIRFSASTTLLVYDLPPGARRATSASVTQ